MIVENALKIYCHSYMYICTNASLALSVIEAMLDFNSAFSACHLASNEQLCMCALNSIPLQIDLNAEFYVNLMPGDERELPINHLSVLKPISLFEHEHEHEHDTWISIIKFMISILSAYNFAECGKDEYFKTLI